MTGPPGRASAAPASRAMLTKLAICFDEAGVPGRERAHRVAMCAEFTGRPLASSAELTRDEAGRLIDALESDPLTVDRLSRRIATKATATAPMPEPRPAPDADPPPDPPAPVGVPAGWEPLRVRRGIGCDPEDPGLHLIPAGDPASTRWCLCRTVCRRPPVRDSPCLAICYCGRCAHYVPVPPPNYRAAIAGLREREVERISRGRRR